jgi:hypothetical protein
MEIAEYKLTITTNRGTVKELVYRGNENISVSSSCDNSGEDGRTKFLFPRHVLQKFVELINGN